ncbi:MAG: S8 family serine peptidase [Deltaproteobacteria bacterium]|nr:S8 family serine peptidase [Deltaproteobacteria bacterium]
MKNPNSAADIGATQAWDLGVGGKDKDGNDIVIAIVDGGMDIKHPDLVENLWNNEGEVAGNAVDDDGNGYVDDVNGWSAYTHSGVIERSNHGTHVAGIAGASGNNGLHVAGVNWRVKLMAVAAESALSSVVAEGYGYVIAQKKLWLESHGRKGANVVVTNSSFGVDKADCKSSQFKIWNELYEEMGKLGILSAAATANLGVDVDSVGDVPTGCSAAHLITVTNTDRNDQKVSYAGYGLRTIALGAPGTGIFSTTAGGGSGSMTGTSMSSPHVAGSVALLHHIASAAFQELNRNDPPKAALMIKKIIMDNVDKLDSLKGKTISGGRLNLVKAAQAISHFQY